MLRIFFPWGYGEQSIFNEINFFLTNVFPL